ncbi:MAG: hypothetical protein EB127_08225 [Alphaproteobacteria bacterium]|nr:hypothetical protein [Alphaproteobacteria bacterium]
MKNKITTDKVNIERFEKTGHLVGKKIECNQCSTLITCFGSNLDSKIKKFGSIENLLESFICRKCISASKPKKIVIKAKKIEKKPVEETVYEIPKMKFSIPRNVLLSDAPDIQKACSSNGNCLSPNFYLDHNKSCIGCAFYDNCCSNLKKAA